MMGVNKFQNLLSLVKQSCIACLAYLNLRYYVKLRFSVFQHVCNLL